MSRYTEHPLTAGGPKYSVAFSPAFRMKITDSEPLLCSQQPKAGLFAPGQVATPVPPAPGETYWPDVIADVALQSPEQSHGDDGSLYGGCSGTLQLQLIGVGGSGGGGGGGVDLVHLANRASALSRIAVAPGTSRSAGG